MNDNLTSWQKVWHHGVAPQMSTRAIKALREGLAVDDPRLTQGSTTTPRPVQAVLDWPCEGACLIGYGGWQGEDRDTVGEVEEYFARVCFATDQALGEPAAVRMLLNFFDDEPRDEMIRKLLPEVDRVLAERAAIQAFRNAAQSAAFEALAGGGMVSDEMSERA